MGKYYYSQECEIYMSKADYLTAVHYALRYPELKKRYNNLYDTRSIDYSKPRVKSSNNFDSTQNYAIERQQLSDKIEKIESAIRETIQDDGIFEEYLKLAVCYGYTFEQLLGKKIPISRNTFYKLRKKFYFILSKKI